MPHGEICNGITLRFELQLKETKLTIKARVERLRDSILISTIEMFSLDVILIDQKVCMMFLTEQLHPLLTFFH